jgi:hypothetical protein
MSGEWFIIDLVNLNYFGSKYLKIIGITNAPKKPTRVYLMKRSP